MRRGPLYRVVKTVKQPHISGMSMASFERGVPITSTQIINHPIQNGPMCRGHHHTPLYCNCSDVRLNQPSSEERTPRPQ